MALDDDPLPRSELNENSTRYDYFRAVPPANELHIIWITWSVLAYIVAASCGILILGVLLSPKARKNPFNLDLVFLTIPDFIFSFLCATTCAMNASSGHYYSSAMCEFQSWYVAFGFSANMWMNAVIANQFHDALRHSSRRRRYKITPRRIYQAAGIVYLYSAFLASWTMIPALPHEANASRGNACVPLEHDLPSTLFFWLVYVPAFMLIPFTYVIYVCWDVHRKRMLPCDPCHRTRRVALYFLRLLFIFVFMWTPTLVLIFADGGKFTHWTAFAGGTWSHFQGLVSVLFSLTKPDVRKAVMELLCCKACKTVDRRATAALDHQQRRFEGGGGEDATRHDNILSSCPGQQQADAAANKKKEDSWDAKYSWEESSDDDQYDPNQEEETSDDDLEGVGRGRKSSRWCFAKNQVTDEAVTSPSLALDVNEEEDKRGPTSHDGNNDVSSQSPLHGCIGSASSASDCPGTVRADRNSQDTDLHLVVKKDVNENHGQEKLDLVGPSTHIAAQPSDDGHHIANNTSEDHVDAERKCEDTPDRSLANNTDVVTTTGGGIAAENIPCPLLKEETDPAIHRDELPSSSRPPRRELSGPVPTTRFMMIR